MDVKLTNGADLASLNQLVHLSLTEGFQCFNFEQKNGESCCDYKVRYCCPPGNTFLWLKSFSFSQCNGSGVVVPKLSEWGSTIY